MKKSNEVFFSKKLVMYTILLLSPFVAFAQADPDINAPIDGGLSILIAAGIGYGIKKYKEKVNEK